MKNETRGRKQVGGTKNGDEADTHAAESQMHSRAKNMSRISPEAYTQRRGRGAVSNLGDGEAAGTEVGDGHAHKGAVEQAHQHLSRKLT